MKKRILTLAMLLAAINLFAQNSEPQAVPFVWGNSSVARPFDINDPQFKQTEFLTGFQWGSPGRALDNALMMNAYFRYLYYCIII